MEKSILFCMQAVWESFLELVSALLMVVLVWLGGGVSPAPEGPVVTATSTVAFVIDGDTFELTTGERVRLMGIDTPERDECFYAEASAYLREQVEDKVVRLEVDETVVDKYGRSLRYVFVGDGASELNVNEALIEGGYARLLSIPPDRRYLGDFEAAEARAREADVGLWGACR